MSDERDDLSPAEERVSELLGGLHAQPTRGDGRLPGRVAHAARWQRPLRRALLGLGTTVDAIAGGVRSLAGRRR